MTDVTGFGLAGHLIEMCEASNVSAELNFSQVPILPEVEKYLELKCIPGGTVRNWKSYGEKVTVTNERNRLLAADPQTSGGLLIAVSQNEAANFEAFMDQKQHFYSCIGSLTEKTTAVVVIND
jgi:selenide,water dikinase